MSARWANLVEDTIRDTQNVDDLLRILCLLRPELETVRAFALHCWAQSTTTSRLRTAANSKSVVKLLPRDCISAVLSFVHVAALRGICSEFNKCWHQNNEKLLRELPNCVQPRVSRRLCEWKDRFNIATQDVQGECSTLYVGESVPKEIREVYPKCEAQPDLQQALRCDIRCPWRRILVPPGTFDLDTLGEFGTGEIISVQAAIVSHADEVCSLPMLLDRC